MEGGGGGGEGGVEEDSIYSEEMRVVRVSVSAKLIYEYLVASKAAARKIVSLNKDFITIRNSRQVPPMYRCRQHC